MKKFMAIAIIAVAFAACSDNKTTESTTTNSTDAMSVENKGQTNTMADSTKILDKMLADSNNKMTPDSLK